jgi:putative holliday junction resolvase
LRSLGLDVGDRRIGVAVSDPLGILASPLRVLERSTESTDIAIILQIVKEQQVEMIIVGWPRSLDGHSGPQAEKVRQFFEQLKAVSIVPIEMRDERLTTVMAKNMLESSRKKKNRPLKKGAYDAAAAAVILQSYLNETRPISYPAPDFDEEDQPESEDDR